MADRGETFKLLSVLLQHPGPELHEASAELAEVARELPRAGGARRLAGFCEWLAGTPLPAAQRAYVETFDFSRPRSLHLTYHRWGDLRQRGLALLRIKRRYAEHGFELHEGELPDYLPAMLEFAALQERAGIETLAEHREAIELIRSSLHDADSPYAVLCDVLAATLPRITAAQAARAARLAAEGPPSESVGLEPFAPPEVMPSPMADPGGPWTEPAASPTGGPPL